VGPAGGGRGGGGPSPKPAGLQRGAQNPGGGVVGRRPRTTPEGRAPPKPPGEGGRRGRRPRGGHSGRRGGGAGGGPQKPPRARPPRPASKKTSRISAPPPPGFVRGGRFGPTAPRRNFHNARPKVGGAAPFSGGPPGKTVTCVIRPGPPVIVLGGNTGGDGADWAASLSAAGTQSPEGGAPSELGRGALVPVQRGPAPRGQGTGAGARGQTRNPARGQMPPGAPALPRFLIRRDPGFLPPPAGRRGRGGGDGWGERPSKEVQSNGRGPGGGAEGPRRPSPGGASARPPARPQAHHPGPPGPSPRPGTFLPPTGGLFKTFHSVGTTRWPRGPRRCPPGY